MAPRFDELAHRVAGALGPGDGREAVAANLAAARTLGCTALTVPADQGGMGANLLDFASFQRIVAGADGATALVLAMHNMLVGGEAEAGLWPATTWQELCNSAVHQGLLINSAATEPGAGTPSAGGLPRTRAEPGAGGEWRISGRKAYTTGAPFLGLLRVSARVDPRGADPYGARFLVRLPAPGLALEETWHPAALGAAANDDVVLEDAPATFLYREDGRGCEGTAWFQVAIAATYLGIGYSAHDRALTFTRGRTTAAGRVADRESVRLRLGRARARLEVARRNLLATCAEWTELPSGSRERLLPDIGLAKLTSVQAAAEAADNALRLAGAGGFGVEQPFARLLLETRAGLSHPPIEDVVHLGLAERDLG